MFGSIISDYCLALNAPVAFTLTNDPADGTGLTKREREGNPLTLSVSLAF